MSVTVVAHSVCLPEDAPEAPRIPSDGAWFDVREHLGRRGYRQLPLPAQLALAAVRRLSPPDGSTAESTAGDRLGLWLGSSTAASHCLADLDGRILSEGTESLPPTGAPYFSVNLVPSRAANDLGATGPSVTVTSTGTAVLDAIACARRALALGRVDEATVVAVEVPDGGQSRGRPTECGAIALQLRTGGAGGHVRTASAFVAGDPASAARLVRANLEPTASVPVLVVEPGGSSSDGSGPLAGALRLVEAVRDGDDLAVVVADPSGAATGVVVEHSPVSTHESDPVRSMTP
ncbi:beta-ketoacyl synthase N-terminal-like domain-containing protein [Isoptericola rhizosphaerae]|uniref:beta-ketoacyl synthase N-terminal-like domain-containing protein n=1 Tax=Isoptericola rhizosphaerae TaxID=3377837 RepID=UPI00383B4BE6